MPRRRKHKKSRKTRSVASHRAKFKKAAKACSLEVRRGKKSFPACMKRKLKK